MNKPRQSPWGIKTQTALLKKYFDRSNQQISKLEKIVKNVTSQFKLQEKEIERLSRENLTLREQLSISTKEILGEFTFPKLSQTLPVWELKIVDILPLQECLNRNQQATRSALRHFSENFENIGQLIKALGIEGCEPDWEGLLKYSGLGQKKISMLVSSFNHFQVKWENLPTKFHGFAVP